MNVFRQAMVPLLWVSCCLISACDLLGPPLRDAQWYQSNKTALSSKLDTCKMDPEGALIDAECAAAARAFSIWHASQAYLGSREALSEKLSQCKAHPETADTDIECIAANDAFMRWYAAHQKAERRRE